MYTDKQPRRSLRAFSHIDMEFSDWSDTDDESESRLDRRLNNDGFNSEQWDPEKGTNVTARSLICGHMVDVYYNGDWWPAKIASVNSKVRPSDSTRLVNVKFAVSGQDDERVDKINIVRGILPKHIRRHRDGQSNYVQHQDGSGDDADTQHVYDDGAEDDDDHEMINDDDREMSKQNQDDDDDEWIQ